MTFDKAEGNADYQQDPKFFKTIGDNELEQHPANAFLALTEKGFQSFREKEKQQAEKARKEKGRKKTTKKEALFSTTAPVVEEEADNEEEQLPEENITKAGPIDDQDPHENAPEQLEDEHGCSVPRKRGRGKAAAPNNRIIAPSFINYENYEIGQRQHFFKNVGGDIMDVGRDANPTPKTWIRTLLSSTMFIQFTALLFKDRSTPTTTRLRNLLSNHKLPPCLSIDVRCMSRKEPTGNEKLINHPEAVGLIMPGKLMMRFCRESE